MQKKFKDVERAFKNWRKVFFSKKMVYNHWCCSNNFCRFDFRIFLDDLQVYTIESIMTGASIVFKHCYILDNSKQLILLIVSYSEIIFLVLLKELLLFRILYEYLVRIYFKSILWLSSIHIHNCKLYTL